MSHANKTNPIIFIFVLLSALFCVAESALRKASNVPEKALENNRIAEQEDDLTTFLLSEECVPFFENLFQYILKNVDEIGNDDAIVEYTCGEEHRSDMVLELFDGLEDAPTSDGDEPVTCALAYREKLLELKPWFIETSSSYDTCKEEATKELAFVHENARRALLEARRDPHKRKLFWSCIFDVDDDDTGEVYVIWQGWLLLINCNSGIHDVNCHLDDDDLHPDDYWTYGYWLDIFG
jgi:hypothetical protein